MGEEAAGVGPKKLLLLLLFVMMMKLEDAGMWDVSGITSSMSIEGMSVGRFFSRDERVA